MRQSLKGLVLASLALASSTLTACGEPMRGGEETGVASAALQNDQGAYVVTAEVLTRGTYTSGSYLSTQSADGVSEALTEQVGIYAGEPDPTSRELWHAYTFSGVPAGAYNLRIIARKSVADGEQFIFNWDGGAGGNILSRICSFTSSSFVTCDVTVIAGGGDVKVNFDDNMFQDTTSTTLYVDYLGLTPSTDVTPPSISITSPAAGATVRDSVTVNATVTDDKAITYVEYFVGTTLVTRSDRAPYTGFWGTRSYPNGPYTLTAKAYDSSGNVGTTSVDVIVENGTDTQPPTALITSPAEGASLSDYVVVQAEATDNIRVSKVDFYVGSEPFFTDYEAPYSAPLIISDYADGTYPLSIRVYDTDGNVGTHSISVQFTSPPPPPPPATATLTVSASGRSGTSVTSNPAGISVSSGQTRSATFTVGTSIRLGVGGGRSAIFSGACSSGGRKVTSCTFTFNGDSSVSANIQ